MSTSALSSTIPIDCLNKIYNNLNLATLSSCSSVNHFWHNHATLSALTRIVFEKSLCCRLSYKISHIQRLSDIYLQNNIPTEALMNRASSLKIKLESALRIKSTGRIDDEEILFDCLLNATYKLPIKKVSSKLLADEKYLLK